MPFDRRITIAVTTSKTNDQGEAVDDTELYERWADRLQSALARELTESGALVESKEIYRIRFEKDLLDAFNDASEIAIGGEGGDVVTEFTQPARTRDQYIDLAT